MWFKRILDSFLGVRSKNELENDIKKVTLPKLIVLFLAINITFIGLIYFVQSLMSKNHPNIMVLFYFQ